MKAGSIKMDLSKEIKKYFELKMNIQVVKFVGCSKTMLSGKFMTLYPYIRKNIQDQQSKLLLYETTGRTVI